MSALTLIPEQLGSALPHSRDLLVRCTLENSRDRGAQILAYEMELWLQEDQPGGVPLFVSRLAPDFRAGVPSELAPSARKPLPLLWHVLPRELQAVEASRAAGDVHLQIRGHFNVLSTWSHDEPKTAAWEPALAQDGTAPVAWRIPQSQWAQLMHQIGFTHLLLAEIGLSDFPPAMAAARRHLEQAWQWHREGNPAQTLLACGQALDSLSVGGFESDKISRRLLLEKMMPGGEPRKREHVNALWNALQDFLNLARPDLQRPVQIRARDAEMALLSASSLLQYLARWSEY